MGRSKYVPTPKTLNDHMGFPCTNDAKSAWRKASRRDKFSRLEDWIVCILNAAAEEPKVEDDA